MSLSLVAFGAVSARAQPAGQAKEPATPADAQVLPKARSELAGLPAIAGNNIFGFLFGVTGSYTRFAPDYDPFRYRIQLTAVASLKGSDSGIRSPLQNIDLRIDFPQLFHERLRLYAMVRFQRIENLGYWGVGNGAGDTIPDDYEGPADRYFTWKKLMAQANVFARYSLLDDLDLVSGLGFRAIVPELYAGSKLERDLTDGNAPERELLYGYTRQYITEALLGVLWDTRDDEFNPSRGAYHEASFRGGVGPSRDRDIRYGSAYVHLRWFVPLFDEYLVLAMRALADVGFGALPIIELGTLGGYTTLSGPASVEANRALPYGRQLGQVKLLATTELRSTFYRFKVRRQRFGVGAAAFIDASRVTASLSGPRTLEGGPALRASYGGGLRLLWGAALVVRLDAGAAPRSDIDGKTHIGASFALGQAF
ncbi:MAG: BamA/TamA family outer membrane protein [Polyangiales bacterium]